MKVAIVGCSQSKSLAPFDDLSFEIWGVNNLYPHIPRANRWFEIHEIVQQGETYLRRGDIKFRGQPVNDYLKTMGEWTQEKSCPVYMQRKWDLVPTSIPYPVEEMIAKFGGYFTNSVSWMIALAINEGAEEIHVYGVDMAVDTEYHHQRPSCEYFLGIAVGMGIKVYIPPEADLLKTSFLYFFKEPQERAWTKKVNMMMQTTKEKRARIEKENKDIKNLMEHEIKFREAQLHQYAGAELALKESDKIWS